MAERNANGQFEKGHTASQGKRAPGAGRKPDVARRALHDLMDTAVTDADWIKIFKAQRDLAISGDTKAAQFLTDRKFGKPKESIEVSGGDDNAAPIAVTFHTPPHA